MSTINRRSTAGCPATYLDAVELMWENGKYSRTIPLSPSSNIALLRTAPAFKGMNAWCSVATGDKAYKDECDFVALEGVVTDDEESINADDDTESLDDGIDRRHPDIPDEVFQQTPQTSDAFSYIGSEPPEVRFSRQRPTSFQKMRRCRRRLLRLNF